MYQVSHIYTGNANHADFTIVHPAFFNIKSLVPADTSLIKASLQTSDLDVSAAVKKIIKDVLTKKKCEYIVFNDDFNTVLLTKYLMVMGNQFKPSNKFETLLQKLNLLQASLTGVKVELLNVSDEYSKEFGSRTFEHRGETIVYLKDSSHASGWLEGNSKYTYGNTYRSTSYVKILSINGIKIEYSTSKAVTESKVLTCDRDDGAMSMEML